MRFVAIAAITTLTANYSSEALQLLEVTTLHIDNVDMCIIYCELLVV